jgi:transcriptional regulator with XRE-family HTH domain
MVKTRPDALKVLSDRLDFLLRTNGGPSQQEIAEKCGVHQSLVSRALNGDIVRQTKKVSQLAQTVKSLHASMRKLGNPAPQSVDDAIKDFLASGGDPELLVEQVNVLRRAVSPPRHAEASAVDEYRARSKLRSNM